MAEATANVSVSAESSGDIVDSLKTDLVAKAERGTFGDGVAGAMKGAAIGAGIGTGVTVGVGAVVVASVVLGDAAIGAAIGATFGPFAPIAAVVGAVIGIVIGFFCVVCKSGGKISPEEAKAALLAHFTAVHNAKKMVQAWKRAPPDQKPRIEALKKIGYFQEIMRLAEEEDAIDPVSLIQNPTVRIALRAQLAIRNGVQFTDAELIKEVKARFEVKPGLSVKMDEKFFSKPRNLKALYVTMAKRKPLHFGPMVRRSDANAWHPNKKLIVAAVAGAVISGVVGVAVANAGKHHSK